MVNKKTEITNDAPHRYEFPEAAVEIMDQLYLTKKELSSQLVKIAMEVYEEKDDSIVFRTLDELAKTGLIVKEEEAGNDAIYSITKKGSRLMEEEAEKHVSIIREKLRSIKN